MWAFRVDDELDYSTREQVSDLVGVMEPVAELLTERLELLDPNDRDWGAL